MTIITFATPLFCSTHIENNFVIQIFGNAMNVILLTLHRDYVIKIISLYTRIRLMSFLSKNVQVPKGFQTDTFVIEPLTELVVLLDYKALLWRVEIFTTMESKFLANNEFYNGGKFY